MQNSLFKEIAYSLGKLVADIDMGEIGLPDIQRPFVWSNTKVRDLFDSMFQGYPVGYLLFWQNAQNNQGRYIGINGKQKVSDLLIVDGQQRLTSLYAVLKGKSVLNKDYSEHHIRIAFRPRDGHFEVADAATARDPEYINDISELFLTNVGSYGFTTAFLAKLRQTRDIGSEEESRIADNIQRLLNLSLYPFTALEISATVDEQQVSEIFVRINSKGVRLNQADFILTLMSVYWDEGRADLEQFCRSARIPTKTGATPFNDFVEPEPAQLLRVVVAVAFRRARLEDVYALLRGKDIDSGHFSEERRIAQFKALKSAQAHVLNLDNWHQFLLAVHQAGFNNGKMVSSENALYYCYAMFLIGRTDIGMPLVDLKRVIARWYFMVSITGRYTGSFETRMDADFARIRGVSEPDAFEKVLSKIIGDNLTDDFWSITLPNELATSSSRSPTLNGYHAALCLLGANVLFSTLKVSELLSRHGAGKKSTLERHHLFPKALLRKRGITRTSDQNQIANYALIEWPENLKISDADPIDYVPSLMLHFDEDTRDTFRRWHALPDNWEHMDYDEFLEQRRKLIAQVTHEGYRRLL